MSVISEPARPGFRVVWITGYSASGKTTVARHVETALRRELDNVVCLDGDDLRGILAGRWDHTPEDRRDLARVYFRLCSHLAEQGLTVVISAVAMFDEVRSWARSHVPGIFIAYLDVPREVRLARDAVTKHVYDADHDLEQGYDVPTDADITVPNHGATTPEAAAEAIARAVLAAAPSDTDHGRTEHWNTYYSSRQKLAGPSSFAELVSDRLEAGSTLLEVGSGDGRDSAYFDARGHAVTALDRSAAATELCRQQRGDSGCEWVSGQIEDHADGWAGRFDAIYTRFTLHAMTEAEEHALWAVVPRLLRPGGRIFVECRSINDTFARSGEVVSRTERISGHYRRFIVPEDLLARVRAAGLGVEDFEESAGLAVHGDEDPVVIRLVARA